jgi:hypothetical protein
MKTTFLSKISIALLVLTFVAASCKKKEEKDPDPTSGTVTLKFDHRWGPSGAAFTMNTALTHPATSESITFQTLKYYITNVKLQKEDGSWWVQPESYHLVTVGSNTVPTISLANVPLGNYQAIEYMIGVDSTRNVSGAQTGALSTSNGMFWSWNTGYIFIKAEGTSPDSPTGGFSYHIGGFRESNNTNAIRINNASFNGELLPVTGNNSPSVQFRVNAARFWHGGISLQDIHTVHMPGANAKTFTENFGNGFTFDQLQ